MRRHIACLALILSSMVAGGTPAVRAQSSDDRPPSLSDRLEQFRDDLLGQPNQPPAVPTPRPRPRRPRLRPTARPRPRRSVRKGRSARRSEPWTAILKLRRWPANRRRPPRPGPRAGEPRSHRTNRRDRADDAAPDADAEGFPLPAAGLKQPAIGGGVPSKRKTSPSRQRRKRCPCRASFATAPRKPATLPAENGKAIQPEPTSRSAHKTPAPVAPHGKDVLLTGQTPSLAIEATGPRKVMIGREAIFKVTLQNVGEVPANNVKVSLDIPPGAEIVDVQTTAGTNQPISTSDGATPLEWEISRLAGHGHETLTLKLIPRQNAPIDLAVRWACTPESSQMSVEVQEPKLAMSLSGPTEVLYGQSRSYKLIISNPGNGDAENVVVSLMPIGRAAEAAASHRLGTLPAGGSKSIEVELTARRRAS